LCGCIFICNTAKNNLGLRSAINLIYSKLIERLISKRLKAKSCKLGESTGITGYRQGQRALNFLL
jgi:hypothetical protein